MPIDRANRICFIHIPKTAGTSVESALGLHGDWREEDQQNYFGMIRSKDLLKRRFGTNYLQHLSTLEIAKVFDEDLADYWIFTVVRDPWTRFLSSYRNMDTSLCRLYQYHAESDLHDLTLSQYIDLAEWIDHPHLRPQSKFLEGCPHRVHVFRYEQLEDLAEVLSNRLAKSVSFPHLRRARVDMSPIPDSSKYALQKRVSDLYACDYAQFGYSTSFAMDGID
jgi:hypothetical protein